MKTAKLLQQFISYVRQFLRFMGISCFLLLSYLLTLLEETNAGGMCPESPNVRKMTLPVGVMDNQVIEA